MRLRWVVWESPSGVFHVASEHAQVGEYTMCGRPIGKAWKRLSRQERTVSCRVCQRHPFWEDYRGKVTFASPKDVKGNPFTFFAKRSG